jgi:hypothetical protein
MRSYLPLLLLLTLNVSAQQDTLKFMTLSPGVDHVQLTPTSLGNVHYYRYTCPSTTPTALYHRSYFAVKLPGNETGVIWQDQSPKAIYLSKITANFTQHKAIRLANPDFGKLYAATCDDKGNVYYFTLLDKGPGKVTARLYKVDKNGTALMNKTYDTSESGLNIWSTGWTGDMEYQNGTLALMLARKMYVSSDGLNHQGGIAVLFDATSLALKKNLGQTSSHSFGNYITTDDEGNFIAMDLGDNYPRGIHLHKFKGDGYLQNKVVYTYKTMHGTSPGYTSTMNYPPYLEISTTTKKYYKWSNDNATYTTLGSIVALKDGYMVFFSGEPSPLGKSLDNSRAGSIEDRRNIGFVKVKKNFETIPTSSRNEVPQEMMLTKGLVETGGFYDFSGGWNKQSNAGVVWLTKFAKGNPGYAGAPKAIALPDGNILVLWENSAGSKTSTCMMKLDPSGKALTQVIELNGNVVIPEKDDVLINGNKVIIVSGTDSEKLDVFVIELK